MAAPSAITKNEQGAPGIARVKQETPGLDWAFSSEAEQSTLGALILDPQAFGRVAEIVSAADFYFEDHALIFRAIAMLRQRGLAIDVVTLAEHLGRSGLGAERRGRLIAYIG